MMARVSAAQNGDQTMKPSRKSQHFHLLDIRKWWIAVSPGEAEERLLSIIPFENSSLLAYMK